MDMHIHSVLGKDSMIRPDEVVELARKAGLDGVCITEHHAYEISHPFDKISRDTDFPIFRGMEYKAREGHLLVYGVNMGRGDMIPQMPMQHVIDWVNVRGGVAVPAHPYQPDMFGQSLGDRILSLANLMAVETLNGSTSHKDNQAAEQAATTMNARKIGGSDAHGPDGIGKTYTVFPVEIRTMGELIEILKTKEYYPASVHTAWNTVVSNP
ncbi:MAG: PHP domain-containing protein [Proteobacteria bacterium]|nr:PHP domain-containing protein [Pseudomonadota bacterium]MBU4471870.1 PHP domain-containing protein [Pseudomonadota bacterium]MCG2751152.1 PHP domain-containing protein [Desulfobacteraceae bacterium]